MQLRGNVAWHAGKVAHVAYWAVGQPQVVMPARLQGSVRPPLPIRDEWCNDPYSSVSALPSHPTRAQPAA
eukprot:364599-Chlamydomonas_euryale.AAC.9